MGHIGNLPSVPDEFVGDVVATSWSLANTNREPKLVLRAEPRRHSTHCPSCHGHLLIDIVPARDEASRERVALDAPVSSAVRHATQVAESSPLSTAAELLNLSPRRMVVVVDPQHRPLGVITSTHVLAALRKYPMDQLSQIPALEAATSGGPLLPGRARLQAALRVLAREDRDFALVVDDAGTLMGALLATDILCAQMAASNEPF